MVASSAVGRLGWVPRLLLLLMGATLAAWVLSGGSPASLRRGTTTAAARLPSSKVRIGWAHNLLANEGLGPRPPSGLTFSEAKPICTDNSGNLVWAYAARHLLHPNDTELVHVKAPFNDTIQALLLPEANLLMNTSKYHLVKSYTLHLLGIAQKVQAPIMLIGIGSQVRFEEAAARGDGFDASGVLLDPEQVAFLRRVEESGGMTSVRGKFTAAIVSGNNLQPPLPLGCPSFFLNHNPRLGQTLQQKRDALLKARDPKLRVCVNLPNIPGDKAYPLKLVELLANRVLKRFPNSLVVLQTPRDEDTVDNMRRRHGVHLRSHRVRFFYDVQSWIDGLRSACDFMFGFRIHGTMAAAAAEVPGMLIAPDMRVQELAEAMALPTTNMFDLTSMDMAGGALDAESFDLFDFVGSLRGYQGFDARRREAARVYAAHFRRLGVPAHPGLLNIANPTNA